MFPPAILLFVQSPSACFIKSFTVRFHLTITIRSCFYHSLEFARVNNSADLTDAKLLLDVFERLPSNLVLMSVIQPVITSYSESSLSCVLLVQGIFPIRSNLLHRSHQRHMDFLRSIESLISALDSLNWRNPGRSVISRVWFLSYIWETRFLGFGF